MIKPLDLNLEWPQALDGSCRYAKFVKIYFMHLITPMMSDGV